MKVTGHGDKIKRNNVTHTYRCTHKDTHTHISTIIHIHGYTHTRLDIIDSEDVCI